MVSKEKSSIKGTTKINYNEKRITKDIQPLINSTKNIIPKCKRKLVNTENVQNRSRHSSYESSISQPPKKKQRKRGSYPLSKDRLIWTQPVTFTDQREGRESRTRTIMMKHFGSHFRKMINSRRFSSNTIVQNDFSKS